MPANHTPGVREARNGQFVPTVDGKDTSPTSFDRERALEISRQACKAASKAHTRFIYDGPFPPREPGMLPLQKITDTDTGGMIAIYDADLERGERTAKLLVAAPEMLAALEYADKLIHTARQYFPKSIKNGDRFQLENTCAAIGKALEKARGCL